MTLTRAYGGTGFIDYTTSEQDTGLTWIDGKKVYRKTINFGALPNTATKGVAHNIVGLNELVGSHVTMKDPGSGDVNQVAFVGFGGVVIVNLLGIDATEVLIETNFDASSQNGFITLDYTKV